MESLTNLIVALTALVTALITLGGGIYSVIKLLKNQQTHVDKLEGIHAEMNGMKDAQIAVEKKISHAEGTADEKKAASEGHP